MDAFAGEQERQVKKLKRNLESWREVILPLYSVLTWDQKWYPGVICGAVSVFYLLMWAIDPPLLSLIAGMGIVVTLADVLVPTVVPYVYTSTSWTKNKEKLYEEICKSIVIHYNWLHITFQSFYRMRESAPRMYYALLISSLTILTWIGSALDNTLILYVITLGLCLTPGIFNNETFNTYLVQLVRLVGSFFKTHKKD